MTGTSNGTQKRYDRQIRLWGAHGQERLEASKICVLGAGPMCTEALKNLVLGGIASFTIVDSQTVSEEDLRNNFFFQPSSLGLGRAQAACTLLRDLNDQVKGSFSDANVTEMLERSPDAFKDYNLIIAEQMQSKFIEKLDSKCRQIGAYLIVLRSQGPFASLQISGPELCIIETKPDTAPSDLRLSTAWPDLLALANEVDLDSCDDIIHKHTPWAVLLLKAIAAWRGDHTGPPSTGAERRLFKEILQGWRRTIDGIPVEELNFDEAVRHAHTAFTELKVPEHVKQLMEDEKCTNLTTSSSDFWIALAALKRFVESEGEGSLPLEGTVPDMTATTELYLQLQRVYRTRADAHIEAVHLHCKALLKSIGKSEDSIPLDYIRLLCKNARNVRVVRPAAAIRKPSEMNSECLRKSFESEEQMHEAMILLTIMAADTFHEQHQRAPGDTSTPDDASWEQDIPVLQQIISQLALDLHLPASVVKQDLLLEFCRAAGPPMHTVSAIMGGIAAQEGLKVLLQQFVPLDGVLVYNGIHAASAVLPL